VCGGIPGSEEAETKWYIGVDDTPDGWWMGKTVVPVHDFVYPTSQWYLEGSGTATAATDSGSAVATVTVDTGEDVLLTLATAKPWLFDGNTHFFIRLSSTTADLKVRPVLGTGGLFYGDYKVLTVDGTRRIYYIGKMYIEPDELLENSQAAITLYLYGVRTTGSGAVLVDFGQAINGPLLRFAAGTLAAGDIFVIEDIQGFVVSSAYVASQPLTITGSEPINLEPDKLNMIWFMQGDHGDAHTVADTATFAKVYVTPRWSLV